MAHVHSRRWGASKITRVGPRQHDAAATTQEKQHCCCCNPTGNLGHIGGLEHVEAIRSSGDQHARNLHAQCTQASVEPVTVQRAQVIQSIQCMPFTFPINHSTQQTSSGYCMDQAHELILASSKPRLHHAMKHELLSALQDVFRCIT